MSTPKRLCPKCQRPKLAAMFKHIDPAAEWCRTCRDYRPPRTPKVGAVNYQPPADDGPVCSSATELNLDDRRVVIVQRIGGVVRITTGRRVKRSETDSFVTGGTVLLPIENLREILREALDAAEDVD